MDYRDLEAQRDYVQASNNIIGFSLDSDNFSIEWEFDFLMHTRGYASQWMELGSA